MNHITRRHIPEDSKTIKATATVTAQPRRQVACFSIGLIFEPEDGSKSFLRNVSGFPTASRYITEDRRMVHGPINLLARVCLPSLTPLWFPNRRVLPRVCCGTELGRSFLRERVSNLSQLAACRMFLSDSALHGRQKMHLTSRQQGKHSFLYGR